MTPDSQTSTPDGEDARPKRSARQSRSLEWTAHVQAHAKPLLVVAVASGLGIAASFAFHLLSARYLPPDDFGLLAAFFVIVNVAAIGSGSLQSAVAVQTAASERSMTETSSARRLRERVPTDALILGLSGAAAVAVLSPWLAQVLATSPIVVIAAALTIPFSFVFADAVGLLQGSGRVDRAVQWSTLAQITRVVFAVIVIGVGTGLGGMVGAVVAASVTTVIGAVWSAKAVRRPEQGAFSNAGMTIIVLSVAFAWLTNSDTIFLRAEAPPHLAGTYASAVILVKTGFLLPTTLSLYLLPRFVRNRDDANLSRLGVLFTLALTVATGIAMTGAFALVGDWLIVFLYGVNYSQAADFLVPASLAYLPWIAAQGMLIRMTSMASRAAALMLIGAVVAQWITFTLTLPDIPLMLISYASIGVAVLLLFVFIDSSQRRRRIPGAASAR